jgi:hypothetical protein
MKDKIKYLLDDILYLLEIIDEQGFSNEKIKESIKDNIIEIKNTLKGDK